MNPVFGGVRMPNSTTTTSLIKYIFILGIRVVVGGRFSSNFFVETTVTEHL